MSPSLAWLDHDPAERARSQKILSMFQEKASRDELGLGAIREGIADHLFPGTSTIQTRLRYMLFVAWMYRHLEDTGTTSAKMELDGRKFETSLIDALIESGETGGLIGKRARKTLKRLPSSVYWTGLGKWGIRLFDGSQSDYHGYVDEAYRLRKKQKKLRSDEECAEALDRFQPWVTWRELPQPPENFLPFPREVTFQLTDDEADYLEERILQSCCDSLLADLVRRHGSADVTYVWEHPNRADFRQEHKRLVEHARLFADALYPAAILYNLMLSEMANNPDYLAKNKERLDFWAETFSKREIASWDLEDAFDAAHHPSHTISSPLRSFVTQWVSLLRQHGPKIHQSPEARALVKLREQKLKGPRSRFTNAAAREKTWIGDAGAFRFDFRWGKAKTFLDDLDAAREVTGV